MSGVQRERWALMDHYGAAIGMVDQEAGLPLAIAYQEHGGLRKARERAKLMGAAPDLLAALMTTVENYHNALHGGRFIGASGIRLGDCPNRTCKQARDALAKAGGEAVPS